jgi:hypothetical protein
LNRRPWQCFSRRGGFLARSLGCGVRSAVYCRVGGSVSCEFAAECRDSGSGRDVSGGADNSYREGDADDDEGDDSDDGPGVSPGPVAGEVCPVDGVVGVVVGVRVAAGLRVDGQEASEECKF